MNLEPTYRRKQRRASASIVSSGSRRIHLLRPLWYLSDGIMGPVPCA